MKPWIFLCLCGAGCASIDSVATVPEGGAVDAMADATNPFVDAAAPEAGPLGCSGDLRSVIDGQGNVVQTCPNDQGCEGGMCVAACQAAAASKGSVGCDYVVPTPAFLNANPPCFAIFVANNWPTAVDISVSRGGASYSVSTFGRIAQAGVAVTAWQPVPTTGLPPGDVAVLFMSHDPESANGTVPMTCPVAPAISQSSGTAIPDPGSGAPATGLGAAFHVTTNMPVTMYDILPFGGASTLLPSAELLLPTSAWGTNYLGIVATRGFKPAPQWGQIVAMEDGTQVTVLPNVALPSGTGVVAAPANTQTVYNLSAGQYVQWQDSGEMSGTVIQSNNPIGFFGGETRDCYDSVTSPTGGGCDSAHQQIPPVSALGNEYVISPFTTRMASLAPESIPYRFVGTQPGTTLTYDPAVSAAPTTLTEGQVVDFETTIAFVVRSQDAKHPFYVAQLMPGCLVTGGSRPGNGPGAFANFCLGDEEFVNVIPPAQFLQKYVFFSDPTYATTNLVVTRTKTSSGFQDVTLDCLGSALTGWTAIDTAGMYEYTNVDLIRAAIPNGPCNNGPQGASSNGPFGITVWGLDYAASYAYPAGGNVASINNVVIPPTPH